MFKVGDTAVYPAHGVAVVKDIENKMISGKKMQFYILKILDNGMTVMVPKDNAESVGLRQIIAKEKVPKVMRILKDKTRNRAYDHLTWNRRYREYMEKIKTGSVYEIAEVLRDLFLLRTDKDLSFGEKRMLETARNLLVKELSLAKKVEETKMEAEIRQIFEN
ncbi:MAG: CarD family transcriptional regulator [Deltaproteobacteria bacterium]|nr:CarD family transcriptional regulator [Deltaproteobacteria bacterium]